MGWCTHMWQVTEIVAREESRLLGHSPRKLWPPESECPACRDSPIDDSDWDDETVYIFLMEFYGLKGGEVAAYHHSQAVTRRNSVGLPYWAVSGMVMASCGFVVAICYSRVKKLKFKYRLAWTFWLLLFSTLKFAHQLGGLKLTAHYVHDSEMLLTLPNKLYHPTAWSMGCGRLAKRRWHTLLGTGTNQKGTALWSTRVVGDLNSCSEVITINLQKRGNEVLSFQGHWSRFSILCFQVFIKTLLRTFFYHVGRASYVGI